MKLFIDSGSLREIESLVPLGIIDGVTTNPSLMAKESEDPRQIIKRICQLVRGPVSAEVLAVEAWAEAVGLVTLVMAIVDAHAVRVGGLPQVDAVTYWAVALAVVAGASWALALVTGIASTRTCSLRPGISTVASTISPVRKLFATSGRSSALGFGAGMMRGRRCACWAFQA